MPMMIEMRLKDGRELTATCVIVSSSGRGAMLFTPSDRATRNFIAKAHVVLFRTWGGDGVFPSYFGYNSEDEVACLVTDMFLCFDHVLGSAEA